MTCIVGIEHGGKVYIGADAAASDGNSIITTVHPKVFRNGPFVIGYTTSFRMGQLLQHVMKPPALTTFDADPHAFMVTNFIDAMRKAFEAGGWLRKDSERESGGTFLVGVRGHLFWIDSDHQVGQSADGYMSVGCGDHMALGSLYSTAGQKVRSRISLALEAAAHHSPSVAGPFTIKSTQ